MLTGPKPARLESPTIVVAVVATLFALISLRAASGAAPPRPSAAEDLINQLQSASDPELLTANYRYVADGNTFWPLEPASANIPPSARKLVAMGVEALPSLFAHLNDTRPTQVTLCKAVNNDLWFGDIYDRRYPEPWLEPPGVNRETEETATDRGGPPEVTLKRYTARVGDLCYVLIGKIVNRSLNAETGTPANLIISSPLERPALIAAVKQDWYGLTREEHLASLENDAFNCGRGDPADAVKRLLFYYRDRGEGIAVRLLALPAADHTPADDLADALLQSDDRRVWAQLLRRFQQEHGSRLLPDTVRRFQLWAILPLRIFRREQLADQRHMARRQARAKTILRRYFPSTDPYHPVRMASIGVRRKWQIVSALAPCKSRRLDAAVLRTFRGLDPRNTPGAWADYLATACMDRLHNEPRAEFISYCRARLTLIGANPKTGTEAQSRELLQVRLGQLMAQQGHPASGQSRCPIRGRTAGRSLLAGDDGIRCHSAQETTGP